jgi:hypothetical protein
MIGITMTEYTIEIPSYRRTVTVYGGDTEENQNKAVEEFIRQIKDDIRDYAEIIDAVTETDYEVPYKEAI